MTELFVAVLVVGTCILCGVLGGIIGRQKGQGGLGATLGAFFGPFGLLIVAVLQPRQPGRWDRYRSDLEPRAEWPEEDLPEARPADRSRPIDPLDFLTKHRRN